MWKWYPSGCPGQGMKVKVTFHPHSHGISWTVSSPLRVKLVQATHRLCYLLSCHFLTESLAVYNVLFPSLPVAQSNKGIPPATTIPSFVTFGLLNTSASWRKYSSHAFLSAIPLRRPYTVEVEVHASMAWTNATYFLSMDVLSLSWSTLCSYLH